MAPFHLEHFIDLLCSLEPLPRLDQMLLSPSPLYPTSYSSLRIQMILEPILLPLLVKLRHLIQCHLAIPTNPLLQVTIILTHEILLELLQMVEDLLDLVVQPLVPMQRPIQEEQRVWHQVPIAIQLNILIPMDRIQMAEPQVVDIQIRA